MLIFFGRRLGLICYVAKLAEASPASFLLQFPPVPQISKIDFLRHGGIFVRFLTE
jgi:hypothetical protein